jgi:hypothetical protein
MKLNNYKTCIWFIVLLLATIPLKGNNLTGRGSTGELAASQKPSKLEILSNSRLEILNQHNFLFKENSFDEKTVYQILGIAAFAGFAVTVIFFNQDIFSPVPIALLGAGVLFLILSI